MYVILIGPSGTRKSTAMSIGYELLKRQGIFLAAESVTREALIEDLEGQSELSVQPGENISAKDVSSHCSMTVYNDELAVFFRKGDEDFVRALTAWYDCLDRFEYKTKNSGQNKLVGVWVNMIGATTPEILNRVLPPEAYGGGLNSRIIYVYADRKGKVVPYPFRVQLNQDLFEDLHVDLEKIKMLRGQFKYSEEFLDQWGPWYLDSDKHPPFTDYHLSGYCHKRGTHLLKLCQIISASRGDDLIIAGTDFARALDILVETEKNMEKVYKGVGENPQSQVLERIKETIFRAGTISFKDLLAQFIFDVTGKDDLIRILVSLKAAGLCELEKVENEKDGKYLMIHAIRS